MRSLEAEIADKEAEVRALRAALDRRGEPSPVWSSSPVVAAVSLIAIFAIIAGAYFLTTPKRRLKLAEGPGDDPPPPAAVVPGAGAEDPVGVPECDAYLRRMETCVMPKVPDRASFQQTLKQQRDAFRMATAHPASREAVRKACIDADRAIADTCR